MVIPYCYAFHNSNNVNVFSNFLPILRKKKKQMKKNFFAQPHFVAKNVKHYFTSGTLLDTSYFIYFFLSPHPRIEG